MVTSIVRKLGFTNIPLFQKPLGDDPLLRFLIFVAVVILLLTVFGESSFADMTKLPGGDESSKLEAAGTLLRLIDTGLFKWGARIFAGICIMSSGWALKEQRFGIAIICVIGAIIFGTAPTWVRNIFEIGGGNGVFSMRDDRSSSAKFVVSKATKVGSKCIAIKS